MGLGNIVIGVVDCILMADIAGQILSAETIIPKRVHDLVASLSFLGRDDDVGAVFRQTRTVASPRSWVEPVISAIQPDWSNGLIVKSA